MEYQKYHNEEGSQVEAYQTTEVTKVMTVNGKTTVAPGAYVVRTDNPYYHDVVDRKTFETMYSKSDTDKVSTSDSQETREENFDPNSHTAAEVHAYLSRSDLSDEERQRVTDAERNGKNRTSAIPV